jgi:hypothetical protein
MADSEHSSGAALRGRAKRPGEAAAFRARVDERLRNLEAQLAEIKGRVDGLLFFVAASVLAQALLRLAA